MGIVEDVPYGFMVDARRRSGLVGLIGPLYARHNGDGVAVGLRVDERHLNTRGFLHGGVIAALLDIALSDNISARGTRGSVTANLTIQYVAKSKPGDWLEASASSVDVGRRLAHARGELRAEGRVVAFACASYALGGIPGAERGLSHS
jgi:uncharacterized protein (TIGR00369 family)